MRAVRASSGTPWYRNSWPWFIVILLSVSVVGSLATVVIAFRHRDVDIRSVQSHSAPGSGTAHVVESDGSADSLRDRGN